MLTDREIEDFNTYLRACTDHQVRGVWTKEHNAGRAEYARLAMTEAERRGISVMGHIQGF